MLSNHFSMRVALRMRGFSVAGAVLGAGLVLASPVFLAGCGSGSGNRALVSGGGGDVVNVGLGRAAQLIGSYKGTKTLANGKVQETILDFVPGTAFETVVGSYTIRVLSPRAAGGSDFVSFESGSLTGNLLASGDLRVVSTPDAETESRAATTRAEKVYTVGANGRTLNYLNELYSGFSATPLVFKANNLAGTWTGSPTGAGGFNLVNPLDGKEVKVNGVALPLAPISITYATTDAQARNYAGSLTLSDPTSGTPYTSTDMTARLYAKYDSQAGTFPQNLKNGSAVSVSGSDLFVIGKGTLPKSAGSLTIPGVPIVGSVKIPLAGRAFVYEAGIGTESRPNGQLGALWLKFDATTDPTLYPLFTQFAGQNTDTTGGYILVGYFYAEKGQTTPAPVPTTPPTGTPAVGTIQFSNVTSTSANTANITSTVSQATVGNQTLLAELRDSNTKSLVRVLSIPLGIGGDLSSVTVGKTYPITATGYSPASGTAAVHYTETIQQSTQSPEYWDAQSGSVVVTARSGNIITLSVNAQMTAYKSVGATATGTFTINASGQFTVK